MGVNVKSKLCVSHRSLLLTSLLVVILASFCFISVLNDVSLFALGVSDKIVNNESELRSAVNNAAGSTIVALNKDIVLTGSLNITNNKDITLTSSKTVGYYKLIGAEGMSTIFVAGGSVLKLDGVIVTHVNDAGKVGGGVYVEANGLLIMYSGEISGNTVRGYGISFLMGGDSSYGGGVYNSGVFELYGGKIFGNLASVGMGGGIANNGTFKMFGGEISNNNATTAFFTDSETLGYGGGVYSMGTFSMSGGAISGNTAQYGGGVYSYNGIFESLGGVISGNTASAYNDVYPSDSGGASNGGNGGGFGGDGGFSNGDNGTSVDNNGGGSFGGGFSFRAVVVMCVGVVAVSMCVIVFVLLFSSQKRLYQIET